MSTPFEQWIACPVCRATGIPPDVKDWDTDYSPPACERCEGCGEIDPATATAEEIEASARVSIENESEWAKPR